MEQSRWLSALVGGPVWLKCENLQRTGSFKIRGAYTRISRLTAEERARGVVAASAGNHAQGVALAAQLLGIRSTVFMPEGAPIPKEKATRGYGADVVFEGSVLEEALAGARRFADETGAVLDPPVRPRRHRRRGRARSAWRCSSRHPTCRRCWCRPAAAGCWPGSRSRSRRCAPTCGWSASRPPARRRTPPRWQQGHPVPLASMKTMADGIAVGLPGDITFAAVATTSTRCVTVSEDSLSRALLALVERAKHGGRARRCGCGRGAARPARTPSRRRSSRCSPAATSTRCCSAR